MSENYIQFVNQFMDELKKCYSTVTSTVYQEITTEFLSYCKNKNVDVFNSQTVLDYLDFCRDNECYSKHSYQQNLRVMNILTYFHKNNTIPYRLRTLEYNWPAWFFPIYLEYVEYRKYNSITEFKIKKQHNFFKRFSKFLDENNITSFSELTLQIIEDHINSLDNFSLPVRYASVGALKMFFEFLYEHKYTSVNFKELVPNVKYSHKAQLPSVYLSDEVSALISCVDRANPKGKRDYAILLLAARLGLRASDICELCFDDIDWENNQINIITHKNSNPLQLPLTGEIGNAIIDYIQNGRPNADYRNIFLRHVNPKEPLIGSSLHVILQKYFRASGIDLKNRKHGPHALRHSLASNLLDNNTPLPTISDILGHRSTTSTQIYLKVDINHLQKCALPVLERGDLL